MRLLLVGITQQQDSAIRERLRREHSPHTVLSVTSERTKDLRSHFLERIGRRCDVVIHNLRFTRHQTTSAIRDHRGYHYVEGGVTAILRKIKEVTHG